MSDNSNINTGSAAGRPDPVVIAPQQPKRSRKGWIVAGVIGAAALAGFGAVQALSQSHGFGHHGFGRGGGMMGGGFDPQRMAARVDFGADILLGRVGANDEQKRKVAELIKANLREIPALREQHLAVHAKIVELLKAEKFDKAELERIRAQQVATVEQMSKRITQAVSEASDILTPKQRQDLISLWEKRPGRH